MELTKVVTGPLSTNTYILVEGKDAIVIDPGDDISGTLKGLEIERVTILATHGHFDHVGGVNRLLSEFKGEFILSSRDLQVLREAKRIASRFSVVTEDPPEPSGFLETKSSSLPLRAIPSPGHTLGSYCFLWRDTLFTGDTLFSGSVGRTDLGGDSRLLADSLEVIKRLPDSTLIYPGHGPHSELGIERQTNPFLNGDIDVREL